MYMYTEYTFSSKYYNALTEYVSDCVRPTYLSIREESCVRHLGAKLSSVFLDFRTEPCSYKKRTQDVTKNDSLKTTKNPLNISKKRSNIESSIILYLQGTRNDSLKNEQISYFL